MNGSTRLGGARRRSFGALAGSTLAARRRRAALLGAAPAVLLVVAFVFGAAAQTVRLSFSRWPGAGEVRWVGLDNFRSVLTDPAFWASFRLSIVFALLVAGMTVAIATLLAAAVSAGVAGKGFYRTVWFLPAVAPGAAVGIFWALAYQPGTGAVNVLTGSLGLGSDHAWLAEPATAIFAVAAVAVWAGVGFAFLLVLGAMEQVPVSLHEAARLDGASAPRRFRSITVPLILPVLVTTTILNVLWAFNGFTLVYAMTRGGPGDATQIIPVKVYLDGFQFSQFGPASAVAVLTSLFLLGLALLSLRWTAVSRS